MKPLSIGPVLPKKIEPSFQGEGIKTQTHTQHLSPTPHFENSITLSHKGVSVVPAHAPVGHPSRITTEVTLEAQTCAA